MTSRGINFSIVIPLYNKGKEIGRALNSILGQSYPGYEIIVVNDGSTDDGPDIVQQFSDERIRLISQANGGAAVARNRGIAEAKYEYISFLDADDEWKPDYLDTVRSLIAGFPDAGAYATAYKMVDTDGSVSVPDYLAIPEAPWEGYIPSYFKSALGPPPVWTSAVTIPKYVFDVVGGFPEGIILGQDREVWERIAMKFRIAFTNNIGATYYLDASNRSCNRNRSKERPRPFIEIAKTALKNGEIGEDKRRDFQTYLAFCQLQRAKVFLAHLGKPSDARTILLDTYPIRIKHMLEKSLLLLLTFVPISPLKFLWRIRAQHRKSEVRRV
jgi:glycosyltransferase involved in cell wall biosynthesis